jgi:hypothetical protein
MSEAKALLRRWVEEARRATQRVDVQPVCLKHDAHDGPSHSSVHGHVSPLPYETKNTRVAHNNIEK